MTFILKFTEEENMTNWLKTAKECAEEVMKDLGPFFTESTYHNAFMHEFRLRGIPYERGRTIEVFYKRV